MRHIACVGFGEAARAIVASLRPVAQLRITAHDILIHGDQAQGLRAAAARLDVTLKASAVEAISGAEVVFSAVTAGSSATALETAHGGRVHPHVLCDINAVTAVCKARNAARVRAAGAACVDMAVMAPVHPAGQRATVPLAGDVAVVQPALQALDFRYDLAGPNPGDATVVKMVRSLFVKGPEALTVQTLAAAEASDCGERILASLDKSDPGLNLPVFAAEGMFTLRSSDCSTTCRSLARPSRGRSGATGSRRTRSFVEAPSRTAPSLSDRSEWRHRCSRAAARACRLVRLRSSCRDRNTSPASRGA